MLKVGRRHWIGIGKVYRPTPCLMELYSSQKHDCYYVTIFTATTFSPDPQPYYSPIWTLADQVQPLPNLQLNDSQSVDEKPQPNPGFSCGIVIEVGVPVQPVVAYIKHVTLP